MIIRAAGKKAYGVDVGTEATPVPAAPNLLNELLMRNQVDAALNFSSLTSGPVANNQLRQLTTVPDLMEQAGFNRNSFYLLLAASDAWSQQNPGATAHLHDAINATYQMLMTQDAPWTTLAQQVGITDPAQVAGYMRSQRAILSSQFSPELVDATTSLMNDLIAVAGPDAVGINSVDPNAFVFPNH
jgi:NitT/TauT family transport system substrate-binding protein